MQTLFTIGTQGRHDPDFLAVLLQHEIDAVIDIRLRNEGRYYQFASGKHIRALCEAHGSRTGTTPGSHHTGDAGPVQGRQRLAGLRGGIPCADRGAEHGRNRAGSGFRL